MNEAIEPIGFVEPGGQKALPPQSDCDKCSEVEKAWKLTSAGAKLIDLPKKILKLVKALVIGIRVGLENSLDTSPLESLKNSASVIGFAGNVVGGIDAVNCANDLYKAAKKSCLLGRALFSGSSVQEAGGSVKEQDEYCTLDAKVLGFVSVNFRMIEKIVSIVVVPITFLSAMAIGNSLCFFFLVSHASAFVSDTCELIREKMLGKDNLLQRLGVRVKEFSLDKTQQIQQAYEIYAAKIDALRMKMFENLLNMCYDVMGAYKSQIADMTPILVTGTSAAMGLCRYVNEREIEHRVVVLKDGE